MVTCDSQSVKRMQCCAQHREIELEASLAAQKNRFFFTILYAILRFHDLGYGLLSKWSCSGSIVGDD